MTEPKTAQQHKATLYQLRKDGTTHVETITMPPSRVALRLLVEKWRQLADVREQFPFDGVNSDVIRQCAKELEEALK